MSENMIVTRKKHRQYFLVVASLLIAYCFIANSRAGSSSDIWQQSMVAHRKEESQRSELIVYPQWIVNKNILQYSSYTILIDRNLVNFETFVFFNFFDYQNTAHIRENIKCVVKIAGQNTRVIDVNEVFKVELMQMKSWSPSKHLWKLKCQMTTMANSEQTNNRLAIIDKSHTNLEDFLLSSNEIQFQATDFINATKPKIKGFGHCVHIIRNLNPTRIDRLIDWLRIQKLIGFKEIHLYFHDSPEPIMNTIYSRYPPDFVKIVEHVRSYDTVCKHAIGIYEANSTSLKAKRLLDECMLAYEINFNFEHNLILNAHARLQTNDCFLRFKYKYEFVTNYDFDEIIYPREAKQVDQDLCNDNYSRVSKKPEYSIYEYTRHILSTIGNRSYMISHLRFLNFVFVPNNKSLMDLISSLNASTKILSMHTSSESEQTFFSMNSTHNKHIRKIHNDFEILGCLKKKYAKSRNTKSFFNNAIGSVFTIRDGKSIFNTNYTELINQHYAQHTSHMTHAYKVPLSLGFLGHFREEMKPFFINQTSPIDFFQVDLEYYMFYITNIWNA